MKFYTFVFGLGKPMSKTYCSIASQSPPQVKEHIINIGTAPIWAQTSHIWWWFVVRRMAIVCAFS